MIRILIVAIDKNRGMGKSSSPSGLPWYVPEEMAYFKEMTKGNGVIGKYALVMGRTTYEKILAMKNKVDTVDLSIAAPLKMKDREVFLLSSKDYPNHKCVRKIEDIKGFDALFICGGVKVYSSAIENDLVDFVLLSKIKESYDCDAFLPEFEQNMPEISRVYREKFDIIAYQANKNADTKLFIELISNLHSEK